MSPLRIVIGSLPAVSHLRAMVPLAWGLRAAGHEVIVLCRPNLVPVATACGLPSAPVGPELDLLGPLQAALPPGATMVEVWGRLDDHLEPAARDYARYAPEALPPALEFAAAWRPDLVVHDPLDYTTRLVAARLGIPAVRHRWAADPFAGRFDKAALAELASWGPVPEPVLVLDPCPTGVQVPGIPAGLPVRYVPDNGAGPLPGWALDSPAVPRVCVTFGTQALRMGGESAFVATLRALERRNVEIVAALPDEDARELRQSGQLPEHARISRMVPLHYFMGHCDLLVHHGGAGSLMTAVAFGVPQLVMPLFGDQFANAAGVVTGNIGIAVDDPAAQRDVKTLGDVLDALLAPGAPQRAGAAAAAEENAARPAPGDLVGVLAGLVS
jgi:UDP:flavonoid glycosyltransferase YjiC (YdhE family)